MNTGTITISANTLSTPIDVHDHASLVDVNVCRVCPALIATNDGGATPKKEKKIHSYNQLL